MPGDKPLGGDIAPVTGEADTAPAGDAPPKRQWKPGDGPSVGAAPNDGPPPPPKPPNDPKSYATIAASAFSDWTRERAAQGCNCTSSYDVSGPTAGTLLHWKSDLQGNFPPWHRESTQMSGPTGGKTPTGPGGAPLGGLGPRSGVLPAMGLQRVTYWREGIVLVTDLDVYTLTITVKCTGAKPCPEGGTITKTFALAVGDREWACKEVFSLELPVDMAGGMQASKELPPVSMPPEAPYLQPPLPPRP